MLVSEEVYIDSGIHIGAKTKLGKAKNFIARRRKDGVYIIDIGKIDESMHRLISRLSKIDLSKLMIVASRYYAKIAVSKFQKLFPDTKVVIGRYIPGSFTNPKISYFTEPEAILVCDPNSERVAIRDAQKMKIPVYGLVDTDNDPTGLEDYIPMNNRGRKSIALFFWLLAREIYMKQGRIKSYDEFKIPITYFEKLEE
ncbi:MAG: 30S ribosomal protein S2 [Candidatus Micrarchaeota archaeon]|nr:30S ribosomal protein S2 [Candidatus Micrarchaeota archaeon]